MNTLRIIKQILLRRLNIIFGGVIDEYKRLQNAQLTREANAASIIQGIQQRRERQANCIHRHPRFDGGMTYGVYVEAETGAYVLCQDCQARIRPEYQNRTLDKEAIYNTKLFNELRAEAPQGGGPQPFITGLTPEEEEAANDMPLEDLKKLCNSK